MPLFQGWGNWGLKGNVISPKSRGKTMAQHGVSVISFPSTLPQPVLAPTCPGSNLWAGPVQAKAILSAHIPGLEAGCAPGRKWFFWWWGRIFFFFLALNCPEALGVTMQWLGLDSGTQLLLWWLWTSKCVSWLLWASVSTSAKQELQQE